jgi:diguanylate cyclase (GGDEF)-like protein
VRKARGLELQLYAKGSSRAQPLAPAAEQPEFRGAQDVVLILPGDPGSAQTLYAYIDPHGRSLAMPRFSSTTLADALGRGADHARMIALAFGALIAMSLAALVIWFVLADRLFVLYTALFALQALYIAFLSGQGFDWPVLAYARPLASHAWNVPAALGGAVACLFVREIADLQHYSPRVYAAFRWLAVAFVVLAVANVAKLFGFSDLVSGAGNVMFLAATIFTLAVSFLAWRRGIRAAGWFLLAWGLLEGFTIATAARLLMADAEDAERLLYYGLPLSMVAAAVLIALGVADRLRDQRRALTDAERRAQTDPLTGVLNRRSLIERLDAVCLRARTRELPISLLFIDLDHFKEINDSRGHAAGDACLRAIVSPIQAELRQSDVVGRYGGEEFVVILSSADTAAAHPIAERILERVANIRVDGFGPPIRLTCSIGVAGSDALGAWGEQLIAHADAAVYAAKNAGRNRVQVAVPLTA